MDVDPRVALLHADCSKEPLLPVPEQPALGYVLRLLTGCIAFVDFGRVGARSDQVWDAMVVK